MNDASPELNQAPPKKDNRSVQTRLKRVAGKVVLGLPLASLILSSGSVDNPNVPAPNIKNPTPAAAPSPDFKSQDTLQPYTPQASEQKENAKHNIVGSEHQADVEARFRAAGIENFLSLYNESQLIKGKYRGEVDWYFSMLTVCDAVAKGEIVDHGDPRLVEIRDGWGSEKELAIEKALEHVNNITIKVEGFESYVTKADEPEEVREKLLRPFARSFAPLARALPNLLVVDPIQAFSGHDILMITSLNTEAGLNAAIPVFWHEANHSADRYPTSLKSSMSQKAYLDYVKSYYQISDDLLTRWFSIQEEEKGLEFWTDIGEGYGWASGLGQERNYHELSTDIATDFFGKPLSETNDPLLFQWVAWNTGKRLMDIREKQSRQESLTSQEQVFLEDPRINKLMGKTLYETIHFLVHPFQDFTLESPEEYDNLPEGILAEAQQKMHEARIAAFATFPIDPNQELSNQLRQQFGLKPVTLEKP